MSTASEEITNLLATYAKNTDGKFFLENTTKDFHFIRPSGNPIDAKGYAAMFESGDIVVTKLELTKLHKLDIFTDVAFAALTMTGIFTYKGELNNDVFTVSTILRLFDGVWKIGWMHRSSGTSDLSSWNT